MGIFCRFAFGKYENLYKIFSSENIFVGAGSRTGVFKDKRFHKFIKF